MCIAMWPVQYDLFVCDSADHKVESDPSFFWPRKLLKLPFGFNSLQMMYHKAVLFFNYSSTTLKMSLNWDFRYFGFLNDFVSAAWCLT